MIKLPIRTETEDPTFSRVREIQDLCVWFVADNDPAELDLWTAPGRPRPYGVTRRELVERVFADAGGPLGATITFTHGVALANALTRSFGLNRRYTRDLVRAIAQSVGLDSELTRAQEHDHLATVDVGPVRALQRDLDYCLGRDLDIELAYAVDQVAYGGQLDFFSGRDLSLGRNLGVGRARAVDRENARAFDRAFDRTFARALDSDLGSCSAWVGGGVRSAGEGRLIGDVPRVAVSRA